MPIIRNRNDVSLDQTTVEALGRLLVSNNRNRRRLSNALRNIAKRDENPQGEARLKKALANLH